MWICGDKGESGKNKIRKIRLAKIILVKHENGLII